MNIKKYTSSFCSSIDRLLEAWNTAGEYNYRIHPNEPGNKANYFAIKLGLTTLDGDLPYNSDKWHREDTIEDTQKKYPKIPAELEVWKQKTKALDSNTEIFTLSIETDITKAKIEKFIRVAEEAIDLQKYSNEMKFPPHLGNPAVSVKGRILNELALELGLIDPDWYLARQCDLGSYLDSKPFDLPEVIEYSLQVYKDLGIDPKCCRFPFIVVDDHFGDGIIDEERLQPLLAEAETLLNDSNDIEKNSEARHSLDFRSVYWFGTEYFFRPSQSACVRILWEAWENKTPEVGSETLLEHSGSESNRIRDVFKGHAAWNKFIVAGNSKGSFRLSTPD